MSWNRIQAHFRNISSSYWRYVLFSALTTVCLPCRQQSLLTVTKYRVCSQTSSQTWQGHVHLLYHLRPPRSHFVLVESSRWLKPTHNQTILHHHHLFLLILHSRQRRPSDCGTSAWRCRRRSGGGTRRTCTATTRWRTRKVCTRSSGTRAGGSSTGTCPARRPRWRSSAESVASRWRWVYFFQLFDS